jgi:hypothetical protein
VPIVIALIEAIAPIAPIAPIVPIVGIVPDARRAGIGMTARRALR